MFNNKLLLSLYLYTVICSNTTVYAMTEMAIMMGSQQGASIANEAVNEEFGDMGKSLGKDRSNLNNSIQLFSSKVSQAEANNAKLFNKIFLEANNHISKKVGQQSEVSSQMQNYIFESISLHKPSFYYLLTGATDFDQAFTNGTMYTPQDREWKNIFGFGDWQYDHTTDSFWQMQSIPLFSDQTDSDTKKVTKSSSKAAYNSIFTEYFVYKNSYEVQCEITLYKVQYPFFVGILFNKTRWISGNADSLTKARLVGIYATSDSNIGTYCTEQKISSKKEKSDEVKVLYPLDQIINNQTKQQTPLSKKPFANIHVQPITFVVRIITSPTTIQFKIWQKEKKEPLDFITIKSSQPDLYLYHNIGCLSPGAIAQFKFIEPQDILFSANTKKLFAQEIDSLLAQPK